MQRWMMACAALVCLPMAVRAQAAPPAVPMLLSHQGRLLDGQDQPVTGAVSLRFTIYDTEVPTTDNPGKVIWSDTFSEVVVAQGVYSLILGDAASGHAPITSAVFAPGADRWLSIAVNGGPDLVPRLRLVSVPYAIRSGDAAVADSIACTGCVTASMIAPGTVGVDAISEASITGDKIASGTITGGNIANGSIPPSKLAGPIDAATLNGDTASEIIAMAQKAIPPASNYIANGSSAQNASFNITGSGAVGSLMVAGQSFFDAGMDGYSPELNVRRISGGASIGGAIEVGTDDGSNFWPNGVNGIIGFPGYGVRHGEIAFAPASGFYLLDSSMASPSGNYGTTGPRQSLYAGNIDASGSLSVAGGITIAGASVPHGLSVVGPANSSAGSGKQCTASASCPAGQTVIATQCQLESGGANLQNEWSGTCVYNCTSACTCSAWATCATP